MGLILRGQYPPFNMGCGEIHLLHPSWGIWGNPHRPSSLRTAELSLLEFVTIHLHVGLRTYNYSPFLRGATLHTVGVIHIMDVRLLITRKTQQRGALRCHTSVGGLSHASGDVGRFKKLRITLRRPRSPFTYSDVGPVNKKTKLEDEASLHVTTRGL